MTDATAVKRASRVSPPGPSRARPPTTTVQLPAESRRNEDGLVWINWERFLAHCTEKGVRPRDQFLYLHLASDVDRTTATLNGFSLTSYARRLGYGPVSGRVTLSKQLERLVEAGVIDYVAAAGRGPGSVSLVEDPDFLGGKRSRR